MLETACILTCTMVVLHSLVCIVNNVYGYIHTGGKAVVSAILGCEEEHGYFQCENAFPRFMKTLHTLRYLVCTTCLHGKLRST